MAPPRTQKRKSGPQNYESDNGFVANDSDNSDRPNKRSKTSAVATKSSHFTSAGQTQVDSEGNQYWEISKMRRVTISEFKGKQMVNIREYYEKDGKDLPGKKVCAGHILSGDAALIRL
jgi:Transcriptional Coactivator p15 (PC4)